MTDIMIFVINMISLKNRNKKMKLSELKKHIDQHFEYHPNDDIDVVIVTNDPSWGPISSVGVKWAGKGMDWDSNTFIISPNIHLTKKTQEQDIFDKAKDLLIHLATNPKKNFFTRDSQSLLKKFGYTDEQFETYRHLFWPEKVVAPKDAKFIREVNKKKEK